MLNQFKLKTEHITAKDSPDANCLIYVDGVLVPEGGTRLDCSRNYNFNKKIYELYNKPSVMDLGCAGGCFIEDCIKDDCLAIGLEGSDYSFKCKRQAWGRIPNNLFTCDIAEPFQITYNDNDFQFDVITAWEVIEHLPENKLNVFFENINQHLKPNGIFVGSIANHIAIAIDYLGNPHHIHQTNQSFEWWKKLWEKCGFCNNEKLIQFFSNEYIRGPMYGAPSSFNIVLQKK